MKFGFIAKHRGIWPADWLSGALGVSRGGFYTWLKRPRSRRSRDNEQLAAKVRSSFLASDRTYGARRVRFIRRRIRKSPDIYAIFIPTSDRFVKVGQSAIVAASPGD